MDMTTFWTEAAARIKKYDLLMHPFYVAWSKGELTKDDLQMYSMQYYKHVKAFPEYLQALENRLPKGQLQATIEENRLDELGSKSSNGKSHSDMWLDFVAGTGADTDMAKRLEPMTSVQNLISEFHQVSERGNTVEALAAFYAYESQVPQIADEKGKWLKDFYGADAKTCHYFSVHAKADIEHANVWHRLIDEQINSSSENAQLALNTMEATAKNLWQVLDGMEEKRVSSGLI